MQDPTPPILRRFLSLSEAAEFAGISKSTLLRYQAKGLFPKRRRLGPGRVAWDRLELEAWAENREAA
jgi:prophage regulatory protein